MLCMIFDNSSGCFGSRIKWLPLFITPFAIGDEIKSKRQRSFAGLRINQSLITRGRLWLRLILFQNGVSVRIGNVQYEFY